MKKIFFSLSFLCLSVQAQVACEGSSQLLTELQTKIQAKSFQEVCAEFGIQNNQILKKPEKIDPQILKYYRQKELSYEDPVADFALTRVSATHFNTAFRGVLGLKAKPVNQALEERARQCADFLFQQSPVDEAEMGGANLYKESEQYLKDKKLLLKVLEKYPASDREKILNKFERGEFVVESSRYPLNPTRLSLDLIQIMEEEKSLGLSAVKGKNHEWSSYFRKNKSGLKEHLAPKILSTLSGGRSADHLVTGKEKELRDFILLQTNQSLTPQELFRKSFKINNGDVYLTLLTIENVLSKEWTHPARNQLKQTNKLKPIAKVFGSDGDVFGHWYHLFGMIYYSYVFGKNNGLVVGKTEAVGSSVISGFKGEKQENKINMIGAKVGGELHQYLQLQEPSFKKQLDLSDEVAADDDIEKKLRRKIKTELKK
jgi:hypothetical protein